MFTAKISDELDARIDAEFYSPEAIDALKKVKLISAGVAFGSLIKDGYRVVYHGIDNVPGLNKNDLIPFLSPANIDHNGGIDFLNLDYVPKYYLQDYKKGKAKINELLIEVKGNTTKVSVVPKIFPENMMISGSLYKAELNSGVDPYFVLSFFKSYYGVLLRKRLTSNTIISYIDKTSLYSIPIPTLKQKVSKYIGNKVRQAETLRAWGKMLEVEINQSSSYEIDSALKLNGKSVNKAKVKELTDRLDPKYYSFRACCVLDAVKAASKTLNTIVKSYSNGFEKRDFVENGIPYITVSEVSSGRLNIESAPKISKFISIPTKATINENCVLVVRTGSIGTAVKVDERDKNAVISSHLIKLEFENEELAAAVAVFLNSSAGKVLLHKISYGAVQPQIGQEELIKLPIPEFILANASTIRVLLKQYESSIRTSGTLVNAAKKLVEALIENKLTEQELINAQQALERGDTTLDRQILSRLSTKGIDDEGSPPLFPNLDQLYELLDKAEEQLEVTP